MIPTQQPKQTTLFYAIALMIPVLFFLLVEAGLRTFNYGGDLSLFIPAPKTHIDEEYLTTNPWVSGRYFAKNHLAPRPALELFKKNKPENGYRIFVIGGSTAVTWPYENNVIFSRILNQRLADTFPDKYIEIVNTGIAAINSFSLLDFIDEILAQQPDAILIYAGHNEFYGALGAGSTRSIGQSRWIIKTYMTLMRLKTVQLLKDLANNITEAFRSSDQKQHSHATLMEQMIGDSHIAYHSEKYLLARKNYEANLSEIIGKIKKAGVQVIISDLVSNQKDHPPFVSVTGNGQIPADLIFEWAKKFEQQGMIDIAHKTYIWAKDQDALRFRASEEFNESIYKAAEKHNIPVVPMKSYFEKASPNGIIGHELMLEHLHPNIEGYYLMSEAFFHTMHKNRFINNEWNEKNIKPDAFYRRTWPITKLERTLGKIRIINLTDNFPFKPKEPDALTIKNYTPQNIVEELALAYFKEEISLMEAHLKLAEHYASQSKHELALRQYQALINSLPYDINYYLASGKALIKHRRFNEALAILFNSLRVKQTGYANKWIGQILLQQHQPARAKSFLEKALSFQPDDLQIIYSLGIVNVTENNIEGARQSLRLVESINPDSGQAASLKENIARLEKHLARRKKDAAKNID